MSVARISVIIPAFNAERYVAAAVRSVTGSGYPALEILVVDDSSTDGTAALAAALGGPVRVIRQANQGPPVARNRGLREASGEIIALLDADDLWPDDKLTQQLPFLSPDSGFDVVLGNTQHFREIPNGADGTTVERSPPFFVTQLGCALFRRSVFDALGGFDPGLRYGDDVDFFLRARERGVAAKFVNATTILYRRHDANMTTAPGHSSLKLTAHLKRSLDRRRRAGRADAPLAAWFANARRGETEA